MEFHLRQAWQELLYIDGLGSQRKTPVAPVEASAEGKAKKATARSKDGLPLQTFSGLPQEPGQPVPVPDSPGCRRPDLYPDCQANPAARLGRWR